MQFQCQPVQSAALQSHSLASHNIALQNRCFAPLHQAPLNCALAFLCASALYFAIPLPCHAVPGFAIAFPVTSRRLISMPSHRVSLILNASPSLCETSPSSAIAALCQSPLFHCVAEIRIAPQSLCCSSRPKTELSLAYAVLGCAALHLSAAVLCQTQPFLSFAWRSGAGHCRCHASQIFAAPSPF